MSNRPSSFLSLPVVAALLAVLTLGLVLAGKSWGLGAASFALLAVPIALAIVYLAWYRTLPYEPVRPRPASAPSLDREEEEELFEDPVEEADRWKTDSETVDAVEDPTDLS